MAFSARPVVRMYVFMSPDCNHCDAVHEENLKRIGDIHQCMVEAKYFDVEKTDDYKKLCDIEELYKTSHESMPVAFIGTDSLGGEKECTDHIEEIVAKYSKTGTEWPDLIVLPKTGDKPADQRRSGSISFEKTEVDLGKLDAGTIVKAEFDFQNTGVETLSITALRTACGCFDLKVGSKSLKPGEKTSIQVAFHTESLKGPFSKSVMVDSTDPASPTVRLIIKADIIPVAEASPERWNFGTIRAGKTANQTIVLKPTQPKGFSITSAKSDGKAVSVGSIRPIPGEKNLHKIALSITPGLKTGRIYERVTIRLKTDKGARELPFMVFGNVQ